MEVSAVNTTCQMVIYSFIFSYPEQYLMYLPPTCFDTNISLFYLEISNDNHTSEKAVDFLIEEELPSLGLINRWGLYNVGRQESN